MRRSGVELRACDSRAAPRWTSPNGGPSGHAVWRALRHPDLPHPRGRAEERTLPRCLAPFLFRTIRRGRPRGNGTIIDMAAAQSRTQSRSALFALAGLNLALAVVWAWLAWSGDKSSVAWRVAFSLAWLGIAVGYLVRGLRAQRSGG